MVATARPAVPPGSLALASLDRETVERLARWLLVALALDLVLTRFVVRLAMFIPKGEPWATVGAVTGRIGAAADALVPIVGVLLLVALLVWAGRAGDRLDGAVLVGTAVVAAGGLTLVVVPPTPAVVLGLDLSVVVLAVATGARLAVGAGLPAVAAAGLAALAASVALAGLARAVGVAGAGSSGLAVDAVGQLAFVTGAALVGLAGLVDRSRSGAGHRRLLATGLAVALIILIVATRAPLMWGALAIWSVGLAGAVPTPLVALGLALAVAGLPALHRRARAAAVGASVVLLAGYGLAASGLLLAGLLGLVVAGSPTPSARIGRIT